MRKTEWLKAIEEVKHLQAQYYPYEKFCVISQSLLDQMLWQTLNSIPIDWIEEQCIKYSKHNHHINIDDIEARMTLEALLEDWEAENG